MLTLFTIILNVGIIASVARVSRGTEPGLRPLFLPALALKLLAGITVGLVYFYYYNVGDTRVYYQDSVLLATLARHDAEGYLRFLWSSDFSVPGIANLQTQEPRAILLVKVASIFNLLTYNNYRFTSAYFSLLSFMGSWYLVRTIHRHLHEQTPAAAVAFLFFPSVVFWSSGLIKESLAMAALFYLTAIFLRLWFSDIPKPMHGVPVILAAWILWGLKYYFAGVFFAVGAAGIMFRYISARRAKSLSFPAEIGLWLILFLVPLGVVTTLHPNFYPHRFFTVVAGNYEAFRMLSGSEDMIHFNDLQATATSMLLNSPLALVSGLFRPFLWEAATLFQGIVAAENLLLLVLTGIGLYRLRVLSITPHRMLVFGALVYIIILAVFITLSTPNFGTLSRYRVGYSPFFIYLLCCCAPVSAWLQRSFNHLGRYKT